MVHQFYEAITLIHIFIMTYRLDGCEWRCQMLVLSISHSHQFCPYLLSTYQYLSIIPLFPVHISRIIWELCRWPWSARGSWVEPDALEPVHYPLVRITNPQLSGTMLMTFHVQQTNHKTNRFSRVWSTCCRKNTSGSILYKIENPAIFFLHIIK